MVELAKRNVDVRRDENGLLARVADYTSGIPARIIVVAPHPDDETLGLGGFLSRCGRSGAHIEIVAVSDGERAYPGAGPEERDRLVETRDLERAVALQVLGLATTTVHRLGIADGEVAGNEPILRDRIDELLGSGANPPHLHASTVLVAPWRHDLHPDHEAVGRVASIVARSSGCQLWEVPIWSWYHLSELQIPLPISRTRRIRLQPAEQATKRVALSSFQSQSHPPAPHERVLPVDFLQTFDRAFEIILW